MSTSESSNNKRNPTSEELVGEQHTGDESMREGPRLTPHASRLTPAQPDLSGGVDAVVFDCYGTLMDVTDAHFIAVFDEICVANGFTISGRELWDRWLAEGRRHSEERGRDPKNPLAAPEPPFIPYRETWALWFDRAFQAMECKGDATEGYRRMHRLLAEATVYPETVDVLDVLKQRYRVALLSNADEDHLQICLERNGLVFELTLSSEGAASYKPHPGIFERAAELLGIEPARILYVGDSPVADVLGARAAGMLIAWVNRAGIPRPETMPAPDLELRTLRDLLPALLGMRREV
jgi:2-haloalkanoic acid dehalogenase type II